MKKILTLVIFINSISVITSFAQESIEGGYTYSTSSVTIKSEFKKIPASNQNTTPSEATASNHNHYINLGARYYFLGGSSSTDPFGVYAGIGLGFGIFRSTEYPNPNDIYNASAYRTDLKVWRVFYLPISVGVEYALGPGKVFAQVMGAPRLFNVGSSPDKDAFEGLYQANVGYKISF